MTCKITVKPVITGPDTFTIETSFESDVLRGVAMSVQMDLMDTKERATRAALIKLGWLPPAEVIVYRPDLGGEASSTFIGRETREFPDAVEFQMYESDCVRAAGRPFQIIKSAIVSREPLVIRR